MHGWGIYLPFPAPPIDRGSMAKVKAKTQKKPAKAKPAAKKKVPAKAKAPTGKAKKQVAKKAPAKPAPKKKVVAKPKKAAAKPVAKKATKAPAPKPKAAAPVKKVVQVSKPAPAVKPAPAKARTKVAPAKPAPASKPIAPAKPVPPTVAKASAPAVAKPAPEKPIAAKAPEKPAAPAAAPKAPAPAAKPATKEAPAKDAKPKPPVVAVMTGLDPLGSPARALKRPVKERFSVEFYMNATPGSLYDMISSPSGLSEWFCDDVDVRGDHFTFRWGNDDQTAQCLSRKFGELMRFQWEDDEDQGAYFELRIRVDPMTNETCLVVTDHAWPKDLDEAKALWGSQIHSLQRVLGA